MELLAKSNQEANFAQGQPEIVGPSESTIANFGLAALSGFGDKISSIFEKIPQPNRITRVLGATATLAAGVLFGSTEASADSRASSVNEITAAQTSPKSIFKPELSANIGSFISSTSSSTTGSASKIKFYKPSDQKGILRLKKEMKNCLPKNVGSNTDFSSRNPNGIKRNKYGVIRTNFMENKSRKKINAIFRKGYKYCTSFISTVGGDFYYPPKSRIKIRHNKMSYIDPYKLTDSSGNAEKHAIQSFLLWFKKSSKNK